MPLTLEVESAVQLARALQLERNILGAFSGDRR